MLRRTPAAFLASGVLALSACQKSIAQEPPCPPGPLCEEPIDLWPVLGPIGGGLVAIGLVVGLVIGPRNGQPAFVPERRSLVAAIGLAFAAAFVLVTAPQLPVLLGWIQWGAVVAACLLGGAALRPRGSRSRGLALGAQVYLIAGVVSVLVTNQGFLGDMDLLAWVIQILAWPGWIFLMAGQFLG